MVLMESSLSRLVVLVAFVITFPPLPFTITTAITTDTLGVFLSAAVTVTVTVPVAMSIVANDGGYFVFYDIHHC